VSANPDQRVVILNGPPGVGKTTIGRLLAGTAPNGVCIHGDALAGFIVTRESETLERGLGYVNGATIASNFVRAGYDLVVFEYVFEEASHVQRFLDAYDARAPVHLFTLWAELAVVQARARDGAGRQRSGDRVAACHEAIKANLGELGLVVENTGDPGDVATRLDELTLAGLSQVRRSGESKHQSWPRDPSLN
jgi:ATPase family associated with various cellular activities (AAA)